MRQLLPAVVVGEAGEDLQAATGKLQVIRGRVLVSRDGTGGIAVLHCDKQGVRIARDAEMDRGAGVQNDIRDELSREQLGCLQRVEVDMIAQMLAQEDP